MDERIEAGIKWRDIPWETVNENVARKVTYQDRIMMIMYRFAPHTSWPVERHEAEQAGYIIQGKIVLILPAEKERMELQAGDGYLIPSNHLHAWEVLDEEVVLIDVFSPPRTELFRQGFAPNVVREEP